MANTGAGASGAEALAYAVTLVASTVLFLYGGRVVDGWAGTDPLFTVVGAMAGAAAGIYYIVRRLTGPSGKGES